MAASALSRFLEAPAIEDLVVFRKAELQALAEHFQIPVPKQALRPELLQVVRGVLSIEEKEEGEVLGRGSGGSPSERSGDGKEEGTPPASPRFGPLSPEGAARLRMKLARLEMEQKEREGIRQREFELEMRKLETSKEVRIRQLELEADSRVAPPPTQLARFDVGKYIALVPPFRESIFIFQLMSV